METDRLSGISQLKSCPFCGSEKIMRMYELAEPLEYREYCNDCNGFIRCIIVNEKAVYEIDFTKVWEVSDE